MSNSILSKICTLIGFGCLMISGYLSWFANRPSNSTEVTTIFIVGTYFIGIAVGVCIGEGFKEQKEKSET